MTRVNAILPFAFMGGLSFIAALFCWFLPETLGKRTPEVIEDLDVKQGMHICPLKIHCFPHAPSTLHDNVTLKAGGGVLPYMGYIGMCRCEGYGFQGVYSSIGYINQSVWV